MPLTPGTPVKVNPAGTFITGTLRVWSTSLNDWVTPIQVIPVGSIPAATGSALMPWNPIGYTGAPKVFAHFFTQYPLQPNNNTSDYWLNWLPPGKVEGASATVAVTTTAASAAAATTFTVSTTQAALIQVGDHVVFDGTTINGTYQVSTVNTTSGVITLTTALLDAVPSGQAVTVSRGGTDHRVYGGFTRDRAFGGSTLVSGWQVADMLTEILRAVNAGIDGFWTDMLSIDTTSYHWKNLNYLFQAADQYFALTGKRFWIAPMPDGTAGSCNNVYNSTTKIVDSNASADALVAALLSLKTQASYWKNSNGHWMLPVFGPETIKSGYTLSDTRLNFWTRVKNGLATGSMAVDMDFCYVGDWTTLAPTYNSLVTGHSRWGDRDYVATASTSNQNRGAPAYCHSTFPGKTWTHFAGPMDTRPYTAGTSVSAGTYRTWEGKGFLAFNNAWRAAIDGGADRMQITTWNDYGESAHISPSRNNSYALADLNYYYAHWFKNGTAPAIVRDGIYVSHRVAPANQQTAQIPGSKQVKWAVAQGPAFADIIDITCFLTASATIEVYVDGVQKTTFAGAAGYNRFESALPASGFIAVRAVRSGAIVPGTTCNATFGVKTNGNVADDYHYRSYSSLRQVAEMQARFPTEVFRDDFNGSSVDLTKWNVRNATTQSNNKGYDLAANCTVQNGYLSIHTGKNTAANAATYPWTAGYMDTIGKANGTFQEGYWEFKGRIPWGSTAYGFWPAYWLRPEDGGLGEIDIMEGWPLKNDVHQTLWRDYTGTPHVEGKHQPPSIPGFDPSQWHTYAVEKRAGVMRFYVDGLLVWDASQSASWIAEAFDRTVKWNIRLQLQMGDSGYGGDPTAATDLTKTFDTDYVSIRAVATVTINPGDDLVAKVAAAPASAVIYVAPGTYRISAPLVPKTGQTIIGTQGTVIIDGSQVKTAWTSDGLGRWFTSHTFQARDSLMRDSNFSVCENSALAGTGVGGGSGANAFNSAWDRDQVWWDGARMKPVVTLAAGDAATGNRFYLDRTNSRIYVWSNPLGHVVEVDATPYAISNPAANNVRISGLTFQKFASPLQKGAVSINAVSGWQVDLCKFYGNHAHGMFVSESTSLWVHHNDFIENGQLGMGVGVPGGSTTYSNNIIEWNNFLRNNQEDFYIGDWEAGGFKATSKSGGIFRYNTLKDNKGLDMWVDYGANWVFYGNTSDGAYAQGMRLEVASNCLVFGNSFIRSGVDIGAHYRAAHQASNNTGSWYSPADTCAISISECSYVDVWQNTVSDPSLNGIVVNARGRTNASASGSDHVHVHDNTITQKQAPIPVDSSGTSTAGSMIAGGLNLNGAPQVLAFYTAANAWTMPSVGPTPSSGVAATRLVDVHGNHYRVSDLGTTKRFAYGKTTYLTANAYATANPTDATDITTA